MSTTTPPPADPGGPEYLEQGGGEPIGPSSSGSGGGRRTALIAGGAVAALLVVGGGVWAAMSFFASGDVRLYLAVPGSPELRSRSVLYFTVTDIDVEYERPRTSTGCRSPASPT